MHTHAAKKTLKSNQGRQLCVVIPFFSLGYQHDNNWSTKCAVYVSWAPASRSLITFPARLSIIASLKPKFVSRPFKRFCFHAICRFHDVDGSSNSLFPSGRVTPPPINQYKQQRQIVCFGFEINNNRNDLTSHHKVYPFGWNSVVEFSILLSRCWLI